jgi:signal transduction histidine kinase
MGTELEFAITTLAGVFPLALPTPPSWYVLFIFVRIILYLMVGLFIYHMLTPRMREIKSVSMRGLLILPAIFAAISIYRGADYYYSGRIDPLYPITFLLLAIASFFVYWHILRMLDNSAKNAQLEIEAQRLETKAEFYRRMNHKIRTPLTRVSTNIQIANMREITDHERLIKAQQEIMQVSEMISTKQNDDDSGWEEG